MNFKKNKFYFKSLVLSIGLLLHLTGFNVFAGPGDDFAQAPTAGPRKELALASQDNNGHSEVADFLLEKMPPIDNFAALSLAINNGDRNTVATLFKNMDYKTDDHFPMVFDHACEENCPEIIKLLVKKLRKKQTDKDKEVMESNIKEFRQKLEQKELEQKELEQKELEQIKLDEELVKAFKSDDIKTAKSLLKKGANPLLLMLEHNLNHWFFGMID